MKQIFLCLFIVTAPSFAQLNTNLLERLISVKDYKTAETYLLNSPKVVKETVLYQEYLGDIYAYQYQWDSAVAAYKKAIETQSSNANLHYKYGAAIGKKAQQSSKFYALTLLGDIKYHLRKATQLDPKHINARWALVDMYVSLPGIVGGSFKKALHVATELQNLSSIDGYLAKGYIYEYDNKPTLAKANYIKASVIANKIKCDAPMARNTLRYQIGKISADYNTNLKKGITCLQTFINNTTAKDGVPIYWAYYRLAQIYQHQNDLAKAKQNLNTALEFNKNFKPALRLKEFLIH